MPKGKYKPRKRKPRLLYMGKKPMSQKIWEYIRRNKVFCVKDILIILEPNNSTLKKYLFALLRAGYIRVIDEKQIFENRSFRMISDTGVKAPTANRGFVYDFNTNKEIFIRAVSIINRYLKIKSQSEIGKIFGLSKATINLIIHKKYPNPWKVYEKIRVVEMSETGVQYESSNSE